MIFFGKKKHKKEKHLTEFGKVMKMIRVNNEQSLREQADKLGICPSLLCAYSYGERCVNENIPSKIFQTYPNLNEYSCEVIMAEVCGREILERLCAHNPQQTKKHWIEFEISMLYGIQYEIA